MIKVIGNNSWKGTLWDEDTPRVALVKYASNGLSGMDKQAFVKRASEETSEELLRKVAQMEVKPGEELVHLIALGSTEAYGPNRNGDGFSKKACIQYHPTFVKHAHFYRNHKNKDPKKSYGIVKASAFNPVMQRIELIVALNGNEKAAKANDGLVADKEMTKLASGEDLAVSMAAAVPFDLCSCCGNKATKREEYCKAVEDGGMCKAGGLTKNIGKMASVDGKLKQLYADNTEPDFFDISNVFVPADRIAYSSGLVKRASADNIPFSEKSAEWEFAYDPEAPAELSLLQETIMSYQADGEKRASSIGWTDAQPLTNTHIPNSALPKNVYKALNDCGICLSAANFIQLTQDCSFEKAASLARIVAPLSNSCLLAMTGADTRNNPYKESAGAPDMLYKWAMHQHLTPTNVKSWVKQAALNSFEETANDKITVEELNKVKNDAWIKRAAWNYGLYKLAFLESQPEEDKDDIAYLLVSRDYYPCVF